MDQIHKIETLLDAYMEVDRLFKSNAVDMSDIRILLYIKDFEDRDEALRITELTRKTQGMGSHATLTRRIIKKLEPNGYVKFLYSRADARVKYIRLGDKGIALLEHLTSMT